MFPIIPIRNGYFFQALATTIGNILCLNYGILFGVTSYAIVIYTSEELTPLNGVIDNDDASWITSYLCIGAFIGSIVFGIASDHIGRKNSLLLCGLCQITSWFALLFGYNIIHVYGSRIVAGLAVGGIFTVLPIYVAEISEDQYRGSLGSFISSSRNLGITLGFIFSATVSQTVIYVIGLVTSMLFQICFAFVQESPYYHLRKKDMPMVEKSLRWFRAIRTLEQRTNPEFVQELDVFREKLKARQSKEIIRAGYLIKIVTVSLVLVIVSQFCGVFVLLNYADTLLASLPATFASTTSAIILAGMQFFGTYLSTIVADKINRKTLLCTSSFLSGISLIALGAFIHLQTIGVIQSTQMEWLPLVLLSNHIVIANVGIYPLTFVIIAEIVPVKIKGRLMSVIFSILYIMSLLNVKFYYVIMDSIGLAGCIWIFAAFCLFEFAFVIFMLPETRGKSFDEIKGYFGG